MEHGPFTALRDGTLVLDVAVHVDEFHIGGTAEDVARFEAALRATFEAGRTISGDINFTGSRIRTTLDNDANRLRIQTDLDEYVYSIHFIIVPLDWAVSPSNPLEPAEFTSLRRATGALPWATGETLPHMACASTSIARRFTCVVVGEPLRTNRVVAAAKAARPMPLFYWPQRSPERLRLFVDASSGKLGHRTAHTGFAIISSPSSAAPGRLGPDLPLSLLQFASHRQRRATHIAFSSDVYAPLEGMRAVKEIGVVHALVHTGDEYAQAPVDVYTENMSLFNTLDADGVVQPKELGAAVQELQELYCSGSLACA